MKKLKVMIASMLGAIALVFACVFGLGVNAEVVDITSNTTITPATGNDYKLLASNVDKNILTAAGTTYGVYTLKASSGTSNKWTSADTKYFDTTKWSKGLRSSGDATAIDLNVGAGNKATITVHVYMHGGTAGTTGLTIDGNSYSLAANDTSESFSLTTTAGTSGVIALTFNNKVGFTELYTKVEDNAPTSDEATTNYEYNDKVQIDFSTMVGTEKDADGNYSEATAADLQNFFESYGVDDGKIVKYVNKNAAPTVSALQGNAANHGLKFTTEKSATLKLKLSSTGGSNTSIFKMSNLNTSAVLVANEDSTLTTNEAAGVAGVYQFTGTTQVSVTYSLTAGTYFMEYISGTSNNATEENDINRSGRWYEIELDYEITTLNAKLQKQVSTDKTAIRFVATLEGFDASKISKIESITYTVKVTGYKAITKNMTSVYTSVRSGDTVILSEKANTYYCSYMFTGLLDHDGALVGKNISAYLTITVDGSTITTNSVGYNIVAA